MLLTLLKCKLHKATVTDANLKYEGSVSIDPKLCDLAQLRPWEQVDIYNCNNGERFTTYVIMGKPGEICLNGAAARKVQPGDEVIIAAYCQMEAANATTHEPRIVFLDSDNQVKEIRREQLPSESP